LGFCGGVSIPREGHVKTVPIDMDPASLTNSLEGNCCDSTLP
jgi:hypothetical protein